MVKKLYRLKMRQYIEQKKSHGGGRKSSYQNDNLKKFRQLIPQNEEIIGDQSTSEEIRKIKR
jgi:hypothetical protein